jgi:hypothetical protein
MKQYNALQALYMSFYSKKLYRDVGRNWGGYAYFYLFLLLAITWTPITHSLQHGIDQSYDKLSQLVVAQTPILTIKDGVVSTPENRPYLISDPDSNDPFIVIDTSGKYTTLAEAKSTILVTKTEILSGPKPNEIRTNTLPTSLNMTVDAKNINDHIKGFVSYTWLFLFILFLICSFVYRIIQALLYSLFGKIMASLFNVKISFGQTMQLTMVAITPAIFVATIIDYFDMSIPHHLSLYLALSIVYLLFGILANKPLKHKGSI